MSRYKYEPNTYRFCMYAELEYGKNEAGTPKIVKIGDHLLTKSGARGIVVRMHDIRTEGDIIDQVVHFRDEAVPDDAAQKQWPSVDGGEWEVLDDRYAYTMVEDIIEVVRGGTVQA